MQQWIQQVMIAHYLQNRDYLFYLHKAWVHELSSLFCFFIENTCFKGTNKKNKQLTKKKTFKNSNTFTQ